MRERITPSEAAKLIESETGERFKTRQLIYMSRHGSANFPALATDAHPKLLRFSRFDIETWIQRYFPDDKKHKPHNPDSREKRIKSAR